MILLSGELFQCILVCLHHIDAAVKVSVLSLIFLNDLFLTLHFRCGLSPMNESMAGTEDPEQYQRSRRHDNKPCEFAVRSLKYVFYLTQSVKVLYHSTKRECCHCNLSANLIKFGRFLTELN